jgi:predicted nucleic acid-binding protein
MVVVLDTDVIVAAVVSSTGASQFLLQEIGLGRLAAAAAVPLLLEYEAVLKRPDTLRWAARADRARVLEVLERLGGEPPRPGDELDRKE